MSTSRVDAEQEISRIIPCEASCSHANLTAVSKDEKKYELSVRNDDVIRLDDDLMTNIFAKATKFTPIKKLLQLQTVHSTVCNAILRAISKHEHLRIEIRQPSEYRFCGMKREKLPQPELNIFIQGSRCVTRIESINLLRYLLSEIRCLKRLTINIEDPDLTDLNNLLDEIITSENVHLESFQIRRKKGGQSIPKIAELVRKNTKTLKFIGRIGLLEAAESFDKDLCLDRLCLMTFDLGLDASGSRICDHLTSILRSGATFRHLSYTSFVGFDPTDETVQNFLDTCQVQSLRLTMMKGPCIMAQPDYMIGKVRRVTHLELGEVVEKPNIFNSLVTYENIFKKVFPYAEDIHYFQMW